MNNCVSEDNVLKRAYYLFLNTGETDAKKNYFAALAEEIRYQGLQDYLELKNKIIMQRHSPQKKHHLITISEFREF